MAVLIRLCRTDKRRNSTKIVTAFPFYDTATLKEPTSVTNPSMIIQADASIIQYNYMRIDEFNRYYWVDDIISLSNDIWEIRASVDALASFREAIGHNTMYIQRSSRWKDGSIIDMMYPATGNVSAQWNQVLQTTSYTIGTNFTQGCYVIGALGENDESTSVIGQTLYVLTPTQYRELCHSLMDASGEYSWGGLAEGIVNALFNPTDYITSAYWFPIVMNTQRTQVMHLGKWVAYHQENGQTVPMSVGVLSGDPYAVQYQAGVAKHPQQTRGKYLNMSPFSQYYLDLGYGSWRLDSSMMVDAANININYAIDPSTGIAVVSVVTEDGKQQLLNMKVNYGVPVNLSTTKNNIINTFTETLGNAASFALGGNVMAGLGLAKDALIGTADIFSGGTISNAGGNGSLACHQVTKKLYCRFFEVATDDPERNGYPLCKVLQPSAGGIAGGYIKASFERLSLPGTLEPEAREIEQYITEGFYYE